MYSIRKLGVTLSACALVLGVSSVAFAQQASTTATINTAANVTSPVTAPTPTSVSMDMTVGTKGEIKLRGAITAIAGNTVNVGSWFGTFTVDATNAKIERRYGGESSLGQLQVGDSVTVWGAASQSALAITATRIQDASIQTRSVSPKGIISALSTSTGTFTLTAGDDSPKAYQITIAPNATIRVSMHNGAATVADLANGMEVQVWGTLNRNNSSISATRVTAKAHAVHYSGSVSNVSTGASTLTLTTPDHGVVQVTLASGAQIRLNGGAAAITDIVNGMTAQVWGNYLGDPAVVTVNRLYVRTSAASVQAAATVTTPVGGVNVGASTTVSH